MLAERNLLVGGEPGAGKSVALNLIVAHAALSLDCRLVLVDGKRVELGVWKQCADVFVGPSIDDAIRVLKQLQTEMDDRYERLLATGRRKLSPQDGVPVILAVFDEVAYFSATVGEPKQQKEFTAVAGPRRKGTCCWGHRHRGHAAAVGRHHPDLAAGPVRLPVGLPLLHRGVFGRHPRARLGPARLLRDRRGPGRTRGRLADRRRRHPAAGQVGVPVRPRRRRPGRYAAKLRGKTRDDAA